MAPSSALPIGAARALSEMQPALIDPASSGARLLNKVLALLAPFNEDENERYDEEILDLPAVGFLVMSVSPCASSLSAHTHPPAQMWTFQTKK